MKLYKIITIISIFTFVNAQDVFLQVDNYTDGQLELTISNSVDVGGFQFDLDATFADFMVNGASGGASEDAGFMISTNEGGLVLGFSMSGDVIPAGDHSLIFVDATFTGTDGEINFSTATISDADGQALEVDLGIPLVISTPTTCEDDTACNYGADGDCEYIADGACDCDGNIDDECGECGGDGTSCQAHYLMDLPNTGESSLILFEESISTLEAGDEIGLFDASGITESNDACDGSYDGEVLVGAGIWDGTQLDLVSIGSVDLCEFGGSQLAGYVDGNNIVAKVWKASEQMEYTVTLAYSMGDGTYGSILTSVSEVYFQEPHFVVDIAETGESSLIIFEEGITALEVGDEIGLFDANGITVQNEACDGSYDGEVLVGAGIWDGTQLDLVSIGSVDLCEFGGSQLAGYVDGNNIVAKVWKASEQMEYTVTLAYSMGDGTYGSILTSVSEVYFQEPHFVVDIAETGESSLIIFEEGITALEVGDEIGLFDASGITEFNDACDGSYDGEVLVGAGTWTGSQLEITATGSVDMCEFAGPQLAGYISGNNIVAKVWDASEEMEYDVNLTYSSGDGSYGAILTSVSEITVGPVYDIVINEFFFRATSGTSVPDYVELYNGGNEDVDVSGWMIDDEDGLIESGVIPAGGYLLIAGEDPFFDENGDELYAGEDIPNSVFADISFGTSSDDIALLDADENEVDAISYDSETWATGNDNRGHALELADPHSDNSDPSNWASSDADSWLLYDEDGEIMNFGTPGEQNSNYSETVDNDDSALPEANALSQNYPNPFNPQTTIKFDVLNNDNVEISVYDILGQKVATLTNEYYSTGNYSVIWDGSDFKGNPVSSGIYVYKYQSSTDVFTQRMVLLR